MGVPQKGFHLEEALQGEGKSLPDAENKAQRNSFHKLSKGKKVTKVKQIEHQ